LTPKTAQENPNTNPISNNRRLLPERPRLKLCRDRQIVAYADNHDVDLTVVGPDDPLAAGIVDLFTSEKLRAFGPDKSAARVESSKIFAKELMRTQKIPTAEARTFSNSREALQYCERLRFPIVIKADGLALGKGVVIAADAVTARSTIDDMMNRGSNTYIPPKGQTMN
jgi:phosphoribosylamine--glycine ligase